MKEAPEYVSQAKELSKKKKALGLGVSGTESYHRATKKGGGEKNWSELKKPPEAGGECRAAEDGGEERKWAVVSGVKCRPLRDRRWPRAVTEGKEEKIFLRLGGPMAGSTVRRRTRKHALKGSEDKNSIGKAFVHRREKKGETSR